MCLGGGNAYKILIGKSERKIQPGRNTCKWEDNIRMDLREGGERAWTGGIWLRMRNSCGLL
jgi:hypothetical protein